MAKSFTDITALPEWKQTLTLTEGLLELCDQFTQGDQNFLVYQLRGSALAIPSMLATDLVAGKKVQPDAMIKAASELELVHRMYPSIDTGELPQQLNDLLAATKEL